MMYETLIKEAATLPEEGLKDVVEYIRFIQFKLGKVQFSAPQSKEVPAADQSELSEKNRHSSV